MPIQLLLLLLSLWVPTHSLIANTHDHSHTDIIEAATRFAAQEHVNANKVEVSIHSLDTRLRLAHCTEPLDLFWPPGAAHTGQTTVGVQCHGAEPWKIFVRAAISVFDFIAVLSTAVTPGDIVSGDVVTMALMDMSSVRGDAVQELDALIGYQFKRRFPTGRALTKTMVSPPRLIHKGDDVLIVSEAGQLKVRMKGIALTDGAKGTVIEARNVSSNRIIQGLIVSRGIIQVVP